MVFELLRHIRVELLEAAIKSGMDFGAMDIFHRRIEGHEPPLFSMANLEKPGHFDKHAWPTLETRGMTLFMGLPGPMPALDAWDAMVATARRMAELLHLDVKTEGIEDEIAGPMLDPTLAQQRESILQPALIDSGEPCPNDGHGVVVCHLSPR